MTALRGCFLIGIGGLLAATLASCGREAPRFAPPPPARFGTVVVASSPAGAAIVLDDEALARVTPDTLRDVPAGPHVVRVRLAGWAPAPDSLAVTLAGGDTARAAFTLAEAPPQIVLLEGFSNVDCVGCPALAATLGALMAEPAHGLDRVVLLKYAASWPNLNDPHYQANPAANDARLTFYQPYLAVGIPTLGVNGALAGASGQPPTLAQLEALVDQALAGDPGFSVEVAAGVPARGTTVSASATLHAERTLSRANTVLRFALAQSLVTYAPAPGSQGETEFHWVMRDFATAAEPPLPLATEQSLTIDATLTRQTAWPAGDLFVIAFVQDTATRQVLQTGIGPVTATLLRATTTRGAAPASEPIHPRGQPR